MRFDFFTMKRLKCSVLHIFNLNGEYVTALLLVGSLSAQKSIFHVFQNFVCISNSSLQTFLSLGPGLDLMRNVAPLGIMNQTRWTPHPPPPSPILLKSTRCHTFTLFQRYVDLFHCLESMHISCHSIVLGLNSIAD